MAFGKNKGNPKWVRQGQGNKKYGDYHWEYRKDGKYYAEGYYKTAEEAHNACLRHQRWYGGIIYNEDDEPI